MKAYGKFMHFGNVLMCTFYVCLQHFISAIPFVLAIAQTFMALSLHLSLCACMCHNYSYINLMATGDTIFAGFKVILPRKIVERVRALCRFFVCPNL